MYFVEETSLLQPEYAFATGGGSTVYVLTRELALRGYPILAIFRILLSMGTTISVRYFEYVIGKPLLAPMHRGKEFLEEARPLEVEE